MIFFAHGVRKFLAGLAVLALPAGVGGPSSSIHEVTPMAPIKGFRLTKTVFVMPEDASLLPAPVKRKLTICNLFANQKMSARKIMQLLDESYGHVIEALIEYKLVEDRRKNPPKSVKRERRL